MSSLFKHSAEGAGEKLRQKLASAHAPLDNSCMLDLRRSFAQALLSLMDKKHHWAYPALTRPGLTRAQLLVHFQHEYLTYVRDFPVLLSRTLGITPALPGVRRALAENIYEEQTGGLSQSDAHPELFLQMMEGLGFARASFDEAEAKTMHPAAIEYRAFLRTASSDENNPWQAALALMTVWVEGSVNERAELSGTFLRKKGNDAVNGHALVAHYQCPPSAMRLVRAHGDVEGSHRNEAWAALLEHTQDQSPAALAAVKTMEQAMGLWLAYRDGVAERMHLSRESLAA
jgi:pyrroloquinoline quinone (PQQ) biosynthesis protein C